MTTAAFSITSENVDELLATARRFWGRERQQAKAKGRTRLARTIGLRPLPPEANSRPQSHISRSLAKHRGRRFLLPRPPIPIPDSSRAGGRASAPSRYRSNVEHKIGVESDNKRCARGTEMALSHLRKVKIT